MNSFIANVMPLLRKRKATKSFPVAKFKKAARSMGLTGRWTTNNNRRPPRPIVPRLRRLENMIETKEITHGMINRDLYHNQLHEFNDRDSAVAFNIFRLGQGANDTDNHQNYGSNRIGDAISVKGVKIKIFMENKIHRPKVFYRVMLLKGPRGVTPSRANVFKGRTDNKMIDAVDNKTWTVVWNRQFTIQVGNAAPGGISAAGEPMQNIAGDIFYGQGTKLISGWIPGKRFGRKGNLQYEQGSISNVKFYDYHLVFLAYDWYGTPQDTSNIGLINELYTTVFFKDA